LMTDFLANPKNAAYKAGLGLLVDTNAEPPFGGYQAVRDAASAALNDVLDGANVKQRFSQLNDKANEFLPSSNPNLTPPTTNRPPPTLNPAPAAPTAAATKSSYPPPLNPPLQANSWARPYNLERGNLPSTNGFICKNR